MRPLASAHPPAKPVPGVSQGHPSVKDTSARAAAPVENPHVRPFCGPHHISRGAPPWQASVAVCLGCPWDPTGQVSTLRPSIHQFGFRPRGPVIHILRRPSLVRSPFLFRSLARVHLLHVTNAPGFRWGPAAGANPPTTIMRQAGFRRNDKTWREHLTLRYGPSRLLYLVVEGVSHSPEIMITGVP